MPLYYTPPPPSSFVHIINQTEKEEKNSIPGDLGMAATRAFGYKVLLDDFWDFENTDDDDDDDE
jgi:hypothetical protein